MMNNKGQFTVIAALFVAVILISAVMVTYSTLRYDTTESAPQTLSAIDETNLALKQVLGFTVGYYGSVLQITGNSTYARDLATNYMNSGLENIANIRPDWGASFDVTNLVLSTNWFTNSSYSQGAINVEYDLIGLGISGVTYSTSSRLDVRVLESTVNNQTTLTVFKDENEAVMNLGMHNFKFYRFLYSNASWELVSPTKTPTMFANGTYLIDIPAGIDSNSYVLQVEDTRGIVSVVASFSQYACQINWGSGSYSIPNENMVVELLQNGTMKWLGQNLALTTNALPIPPVSMKAIHINQTINGVNKEVPFQVEDWASDYRIPLGLTNNYTVISNRQMIVFQVNPTVSKVILWWDGRDTATQTSYSIYNAVTSPFRNDNVNNVDYAFLNNGIINLTVDNIDNHFQIISNLNTITSRAEFMRIDNERSSYGSDPSYVIHHGIVRDIVQAEPEWVGGPGVSGITCPNTLGQVVITLPANTPYFTYQSRLMFLNSQQLRQISDLCPINLTITPSTSVNSIKTENGSLIATTSAGESSFYNFTSGGWTAHHWSQSLDSTNTKGSGIMFTDISNQNLYIFDTATSKTGALNANYLKKMIQILPVTKGTSISQSAFEVTWSGAVVNFDNTTPIHKIVSGTPTGLWVFAEYPPTITVTTSN